MRKYQVKCQSPRRGTYEPRVAPLAIEEIFAPYPGINIRTHYRRQFLGCLADRALAELGPGDSGNIKWPERSVSPAISYGDPLVSANHWGEDDSHMLTTIRRFLKKTTGVSHSVCFLQYLGDASTTGYLPIPPEASRISILLLGAPRQVFIRHNSPRALHRTFVLMTHGDLLTAEYATDLTNCWVPGSYEKEQGPSIFLVFCEIGSGSGV
jgi:hypothetical protein